MSVNLIFTLVLFVFAWWTTLLIFILVNQSRVDNLRSKIADLTRRLEEAGVIKPEKKDNDLKN